MNEQRDGRAAVCLAVAALLVGLVVGLIASLLESTPHRAVETLVLVRGSVPLADSAAARSTATTIGVLADTAVVTSNVARALSLAERDVRDRTSVSLVRGSAALRITAEADSPVQAVRLVQQYGLVLTELVRSRFGPLALAPFDPAHASGSVAPHWARNLLTGGLAGLIAGLGGSGFLLRRPGAGRPSARLPALPRRVPTPEAAPPAAALDPEPEPAPEPARPPEEPGPAPAEETPPEPARAGHWALGDLRRRVEEARAREPDRVEEWETYLALLAQHEQDGKLPASFDGLIEDVFGSLLF